MVCGGSPCQDYSVAGQGKGAIWTCSDCGSRYNPLTIPWNKRDVCPKCGGSNIEKTRSSLLVEYLRVVREKKPNFGIYENVKNIVGKKFKEGFDLFTKELEEYGYNVYWKVLNAKDYGVPQNRERVYLLFIKKELDNGRFQFPDKIPLTKTLRDVLDKNVDEKFYIKDSKANELLTKLADRQDLSGMFSQIRGGTYSVNRNNIGREISVAPTLLARDYKGWGGREWSVGVIEDKSKLPCVIDESMKGFEDGNPRVYFGIAPTIAAREYKEPRMILERKDNDVRKIGNIYGFDGGNYAGNVYDQDGLAPTLRTFQGGNQQPMIVAMRGRNPDNPSDRTAGIHTEQRLEPNYNEVSNTLTSVQKDNLVLENFRIRKLTPKECYRLMGFSDDDFEKAQNVVSNTQLYKQAGNSIVVNVLYYIFKSLYEAMPYLFDDLQLCSLFSGIGAFEKALDRLYETM